MSLFATREIWYLCVKDNDEITMPNCFSFFRQVLIGLVFASEEYQVIIRLLSQNFSLLTVYFLHFLKYLIEILRY